jgi:hypothetical protein
MAKKVKSSLGAYTNSSQKLYDAEIAVFGFQAHLVTPRNPQSLWDATKHDIQPPN